MNHQFIQHLKKDHEEQRRLGEELGKAKTAEERKRLHKELYNAIKPHIEGEDVSIFDHLESAGGESREGALEALQEHHIARVLLRELMELDPEGDILNAKAKVLHESNRHHMNEEEQTHFPRIESLASKEELDRLFEAYEEREESEERV